MSLRIACKPIPLDALYAKILLLLETIMVASYPTVTSSKKMHVCSANQDIIWRKEFTVRWTAMIAYLMILMAIASFAERGWPSLLTLFAQHWTQHAFKQANKIKASVSLARLDTFWINFTSVRSKMGNARNTQMVFARNVLINTSSTVKSAFLIL